MTISNRFPGVAAAATFFALSGCAAYDRAAQTDTSGIRVSQRDGTPGNPPDSDVCGAYPRDQRLATRSY